MRRLKPNHWEGPVPANDTMVELEGNICVLSSCPLALNTSTIELLFPHQATP